MKNKKVRITKNEIENNRKKYLDLFLKGYSIKYIAKKFNKTEVSIIKCIMHTEEYKKRREEIKAEMLDLYYKGFSYQEIGKLYDYSSPTVFKIIHSLPNFKKRLSRINKDEVIERFKRGEKVNQIAQSLNISSASVRNIIRPFVEKKDSEYKFKSFDEMVKYARRWAYLHVKNLCKVSKEAKNYFGEIWLAKTIFYLDEIMKKKGE
ncbi:MAG: helix-turn-helix domain-containing protein [Leptonema sp. (in: bacteria)]